MGNIHLLSNSLLCIVKIEKIDEKVKIYNTGI